MTKTITETALEDAAGALEAIGEAIGVIANEIELYLTTHRHSWVFLRSDIYQRHITTERIREVLSGSLAEDQVRFGTNRYYEVSDFYYCSGCPEMRRVHMEDYFHSTGTLDGRPHIRFWTKEIPES